MLCAMPLRLKASIDDTSFEGINSKSSCMGTFDLYSILCNSINSIVGSHIISLF